MIRFSLKKKLIFLFMALGPLGNIFTPGIFPKSFRTYYFLLPFFPILLFNTKLKTLKNAVFFLPFFLYAGLSSLYVHFFGAPNEPHPLFRYFLFTCQLFFILGASGFINSFEELKTTLKTYTYSYFCSSLIGYVFFFGYYLKILSIKWIDHFSVLTQFGWGWLRFSPGSYPNEYGIVSSFVLSFMTLLLFEKKEKILFFSKLFFYLFYTATFLALLLTTTRAAYLAFFISFIFISIRKGNRIKPLIRFGALAAAIVALLRSFHIDIYSILKVGFSQKMNEGSLGERYFMWQEALGKIQEQEILGVGFASLTNIHNVYMQLVFELGLIGTLFLILPIFLSILVPFFLLRCGPKQEEELFFQKLKLIGLIHILSFAASNHNLNHHLTWFILFLCCIPKICLRERAILNEEFS